MLTVIFVVFVQVDLALLCTFKEVDTDFAASIKEFWNGTTKQQCFELCYDDADCTRLRHEKEMCTIFVNGVEAQAKGTNIYTFERSHTLPAPTCTPMKLNVGRSTAAMSTTSTTAGRIRPEENYIHIETNPIWKIVGGNNAGYTIFSYQTQPNFCSSAKLGLYSREGKTCYKINDPSMRMGKGYVFSEFCEGEATYPVATYTSDDGSECYTVVQTRPDRAPKFPSIDGYVLVSQFYVHNVTLDA